MLKKITWTFSSKHCEVLHDKEIQSRNFQFYIFMVIRWHISGSLGFNYVSSTRYYIIKAIKLKHQDRPLNSQWKFSKSLYFCQWNTTNGLLKNVIVESKRSSICKFDGFY